MPTSILDHLLPLPREYREIDNHYHLELAATRAADIEEYLVASQAALEEVAATNLRALTSLVGLQQDTNLLLTGLLGGIDQVAEILDDIHAVGVETVRSIREGFAGLAAQMFEQQAVLEQIVDVLRRPHETQVRELLRRARRLLQDGVRTVGREQQENYADANRLIDVALANPIGGTHYLPWFLKGWLL
jgi:hypothetical protein